MQWSGDDVDGFVEEPCCCGGEGDEAGGGEPVAQLPLTDVHENELIVDEVDLKADTPEERK